MDVSLFLKLLTIWLSLLGIVWIINPKAGLHESVGVHSIFVARLVGAYQIVIGIMNWIISTQSHTLVRQFLWVDLLMNAIPIALISVNILSHKFAKQEVAGIVAHALPVVGLVVYLI